MERQAYDTFLVQDPETVPEDQEIEMVIRHLTPEDRRYKYRSQYAKAMVSKSESTYPDLLRIRLGRGQLQDAKWSIKVIEALSRF